MCVLTLYVFNFISILSACLIYVSQVTPPGRNIHLARVSSTVDNCVCLCMCILFASFLVYMYLNSLPKKKLCHPIGAHAIINFLLFIILIVFVLFYCFDERGALRRRSSDDEKLGINKCIDAYQYLCLFVLTISNKSGWQCLWLATGTTAVVNLLF